MKKYAVLVGLKSVNPNKYGGWDGRKGCTGCHRDIDNVAEQILIPLGYDARGWYTQDATRQNVLKSLEIAAEKLEAGDYFVFYFAGHGKSINDFSGDENDGRDEVICLYDGELVDDELGKVWTKFKQGVKIIMMSDSCHSGTVFRTLPNGQQVAQAPNLSLLSPRDSPDMKAQLIHLGACRDTEESEGSDQGGVFTNALLRVWNRGAFAGDYFDLHRAVSALVTSPIQNPFLDFYGDVTQDFKRERPFIGVSPSEPPPPPPTQPVVACKVIVRTTDASVARKVLRDHFADCSLRALEQALSQSSSGGSGHFSDSFCEVSLSIERPDLA